MSNNVPDLGKYPLSILQHTLGFDDYGRSKDPGRPDGYRNHFVASEGHHDWPHLMVLVENQLMEQHGSSVITGDSPWFSVTSAGRAYVAQYSPKPPKLTRGQQRYSRFLDLCEIMPDLTFKEFVNERWYLSLEKREEWRWRQTQKRYEENRAQLKEWNETLDRVKQTVDAQREQHYGNLQTEATRPTGS